MPKQPIEANARKALEQMKQEMANELGINFESLAKRPTDPGSTVLNVGREGGLIDEKLATMVQKNLADED